MFISSLLMTSQAWKIVHVLWSIQDNLIKCFQIKSNEIHHKKFTIMAIMEWPFGGLVTFLCLALYRAYIIDIPRVQNIYSY